MLKPNIQVRTYAKSPQTYTKYHLNHIFRFSQRKYFLSNPFQNNFYYKIGNTGTENRISNRTNQQTTSLSSPMDIPHISTITNEELHCFSPIIIIDCNTHSYSVSYTTFNTIKFEKQFNNDQLNYSIHDKLTIALNFALDQFDLMINEHTLIFRR